MDRRATETLVMPVARHFRSLRQCDVTWPARAHLIGIAGNGMRAMADVLTGWGWQVSGSDSSLNAAACLPNGVRAVRLYHEHAAENLPTDTELVIHSDAVPKENPELRRAAELGIPTLSYFEMLGRLSKDRNTVAVAGTHGKSSATAMLAHILAKAGRDPTVFFGATPLGATSGGRAGRRLDSPLPLGEGPGVRAMTAGPLGSTPPQSALTLTLSQRARGLSAPVSGDGLMLVEACEYRENFLHLRPRQAAILGIEADHFDCFDSLTQIEDAFQRFAASVPADGMLLVRHDCRSTRRATASARCRVESFSFASGADWSVDEFADEGGYFRFSLHRFGQRLCDVRLQVSGRHNVLNALAAAALAWHNGATAVEIASGLETFAGLHRRLEVLGTWHGVTHLDDYAHHPTEVTVALETVRRMFPDGRLWCVFQPHQASRTARLLDEFAASLQNADRVVVGEICRAREGSPAPGEITAADLAQRTRELGVEVLAGHRAEEIVATLRTHLAPGDVLVTLGAGDVGRLRRQLLAD